jgi:SAM-dependent methyltransferase
MTNEIIGLGDWLQSPVGQRVSDWEVAQFQLAVADVFGFHAAQLGLPSMDTLSASRIPSRWVLANEADLVSSNGIDRVAAWADPAALPFPDASMDLLVLPHTLELAADPHGVLREVDRVLVPEGKVVLSLFNPLSLWGGRQARARTFSRLGVPGLGHLFLPDAGEFIAPWRVRDWLSFMGMEVQTQRYGMYSWPVVSTSWLERLNWMEGVGSRWWPMLGALYFVVAIKKVRGVRLLGPAWRPHRRPLLKPSAVAAPLRMPD